MVRSGLLPLAAAAALVGLTAHAEPTVPIGTVPFAAARPTGSDRVTLGNESLALGVVPLDGVPGLPPVSSHAAAAPNHDASMVRTNDQEASEPSVLRMILAGLGMIGFIVARWYRVS